MYGRAASGLPELLPERGHTIRRIVHAKYAVPIMWALLVEARDLLEANVLDEEGDTFYCWAPVSPKDRALQVLHENAAKLSGMLGDQLDGYVDLLTEELRGHRPTTSRSTPSTWLP